MEERFPYKEEAGGSSPSTPTVVSVETRAVPGRRLSTSFILLNDDNPRYEAPNRSSITFFSGCLQTKMGPRAFRGPVASGMSAAFG